MPRLYREGDWVRLTEAVPGSTIDGIAHALQRGMEGLVIIGTDAHPGRQVVEFPVDVLGPDGRPRDIPHYVEADVTDRQLELIARGQG